MRIVAVVVTYNRLPLLQLLVARLLAVDALTSILVIDNASTKMGGKNVSWRGIIAQKRRVFLPLPNFP